MDTPPHRRRRPRPAPRLPARPGAAGQHRRAPARARRAPAGADQRRPWRGGRRRRAPLSRPSVGRDDLRRVVDYEGVADAVRAIVAAGHVMLVETLAERIAESCLADPRVHLARVRVEKLDVFADAASAGVEIERRRADLSTR